MTNSDPWLTYVSNKLAANRFHPMAPAIYQPQGYKYAAHRSEFEITKFGMAEYFFTFAEIPNVTVPTLQQFSTASFDFANKNKSVKLPNGFFVATFCFAVAITENVSEEVAEFVRMTEPPSHWGSFELKAVMDVATKNLFYYEKTPIWGAAYFSGFRKMIEANLR